MSNLSRESWATWVEDNLGFPFWCKIAAICVNIGFIWRTTISIYVKSSGIYNLDTEHLIHILIDGIMLLCLMFDFLVLTKAPILYIHWRPGWAQLFELISIVEELCQLSNTIQHLTIVVSGLRDYFLCAFYIAVAHFHQKQMHKNLSARQQQQFRLPLRNHSVNP
ncbi:hypothetical protein RO3G_06963 [Rhizopus delemar RA 99-880]|uniref:Uncharacterized protein n=1 Tax=Rhizopus delemar (strain RA 99-880 / ATCC MYA-4621 / FGSC 9543 / NRRL 43880) TaxID=246409 RepID=I1C1C8_RHIO9|nr:hypothetical protein RO3G_06963 [Rhizopus delemar RA 99-880]|eukprot:EIE82258.1 hypothetical protein RO3G_06963 [Rhizopus delemar RA 99-880]